MRKFLVSKSIIFHLFMIYRGVDLYRITRHIALPGGIENPQPIDLADKRILIVGMSESPHLHSWIEGVAESEVANKLWLFPSDFPIRKFSVRGVKVRQFPVVFSGRITNIAFRLLDELTGRLWRSYFLYRQIKRIRPTHIHFHETQHGAYLYNSIARHPKNHYSGKLILSTWGSDLITYGKVESHLSEISDVLSWVNLLTSERQEDLAIAKELGYEGKFLAPTYITVGNQNNDLNFLPTSGRNMVLIKGYQDVHGRALNALASIEILSREMDLRQFKFAIFSASDSVRIQAELMRSELEINIIVLGRMPKSELMRYFMEARIYVGLAISDGLSTSMVEAMMHGTFPIQSQNSSAPKFLEHKVTGGVVDPWNIPEIVDVLKLALKDNDLVDTAARKNLDTLKRKFDREAGLSNLVRVYE